MSSEYKWQYYVLKKCEKLLFYEMVVVVVVGVG